MSLEKPFPLDTFLINCKRRGTHNFECSEIKKTVDTFLERKIAAKVDFENPSKIAVIENFQNTAFIGIAPTEYFRRKQIKENFDKPMKT